MKIETDTLFEILPTNPDGGLPKQIDFKDLTPVPSPLALYYTVRQIAHEVLISRVDPTKSSMGTEGPYPFFNEGLYAGTSIADINLY